MGVGGTGWDFLGGGWEALYRILGMEGIYGGPWMEFWGVWGGFMWYPDGIWGDWMGFMGTLYGIVFPPPLIKGKEPVQQMP